MTRLGTIVAAAAGLAVVLVLTQPAQAQVTLNSVRVAAADTVALAMFYQNAFGMFETNRIAVAAGPEIFMNFGATAEAAKANKGLPIVLFHRDSDAVKDPIPHVILNVTDMAATVKALTAAGGKMEGEPKPFGKTGTVIGMATDPAGNHIEMIQQPKS